LIQHRGTLVSVGLPNSDYLNHLPGLDFSSSGVILVNSLVDEVYGENPDTVSGTTSPELSHRIDLLLQYSDGPSSEALSIDDPNLRLQVFYWRQAIAQFFDISWWDERNHS